MIHELNVDVFDNRLNPIAYETLFGYFDKFVNGLDRDLCLYIYRHVI